MQSVQTGVSRVTILLLAMLTIASVLNIHDMAVATHASGGLAAWIVSIAVGGTLSVLAYVASITDGRTRTVATVFAVFAAGVSTALQVSLFLDRGAALPVSLAFGVGVPFFEVALAVTDSMLRRYAHAHPAAEPAPQRTRRPAQTRAEPAQMAQTYAESAQMYAQLTAEPAQTPAETTQKLTPAQRRAQIAESGVQDAAQIAAQFGVAMRTAQADLAAVRTAMVQTNGHGA